jgi:hypothetical protein
MLDTTPLARACVFVCVLTPRLGPTPHTTPGNAPQAEFSAGVSELVKAKLEKVCVGALCAVSGAWRWALLGLGSAPAAFV